MKLSILPFIIISFLSFNTLAQEYLHIWSHYTADNEEFAPGFGGNTNATVRSVIVDNDNVFWFGTYRSGFVRFYEEEPSDMQVFDNKNTKLVGNEVYQIEKIGINQIWFSNYEKFGSQFEGLYTLDYDSLDEGSITKKDSFFDIDSNLVELLWPVTCLKKIEFNLHDEMWVGSTHGILTSKLGDTLYQNANFTKEVISITQDSKKNIYVLEKGNTLKVQGSNFKNFSLNTFENQLGSFSAKKAISGPGDTLWILTNKGIIKQHFNDTTRSWSSILYNDSLKLSPNEPKDLAFDSLGHPWIIFENNGGVLNWNYKTSMKFEMASVNTSAIIPDESSIIFSDNTGNIWIGTDNDGLFVHRNSVTIGLVQPEFINFRVYPNPTSNCVTVELPTEILGNSKCTLLSSDGRQFEVAIDGRNIALPQAANGLYVLIVRHQNQIYRTFISIYN